MGVRGRGGSWQRARPGAAPQRERRPGAAARRRRDCGGARMPKGRPRAFRSRALEGRLLPLRDSGQKRWCGHWRCRRAGRAGVSEAGARACVCGVPLSLGPGAEGAASARFRQWLSPRSPRSLSLTRPLAPRALFLFSPDRRAPLLLRATSRLVLGPGSRTRHAIRNPLHRERRTANTHGTGPTHATLSFSAASIRSPGRPKKKAKQKKMFEALEPALAYAQVRLTAGWRVGDGGLAPE